MAVHLDNPAGRLHQLLTQLRSLPQPRNSPPRVGTAWATVLDVPADDLPELGRRLLPVLQLPAQIEAQVATLSTKDYDHELLLRWRNNVTTALQNSFAYWGHSLEKVTSAYNGETLAYLEQCSDALHRRRPEPMVSEDALKSLLAQVGALGDEVSDAEIDEDLRVFLVYHLNSMARAIQDFPVCGSAALQDAYDRAFGSLVRRADLWRKWEREPPWWQKFGGVLAEVALALSVATSVAQLPTFIRQALEGPESPTIINQINIEVGEEPDHESGDEAPPPP